MFHEIMCLPVFLSCHNLTFSKASHGHWKYNGCYGDSTVLLTIDRESDYTRAN